MKGERWRALSPHLDRALEMGSHERAAWLAGLRAESPSLADDLEALLAEGSALIAEGYLEGDAPSLPATSLAGQTIGAYSLVSPIGQGGMGSVWLARRSDGRFEGLAAIKLLNAELIGRGGEERFKREASILGRLTHPNIARLIDAGIAASGQPFLVLEHVEGEQIDKYCDGKSLDVESRLRLFLDVLAAVAHAHTHLIVHRDIKPSNVLVSTEGQVKLLDFGIAKLLAEDAVSGEPTALTREGGRAPLTPEYAAPEQVTGGPVTTATDVYALGALLYELLGGLHPTAGAMRRSLAELLMSIVDTEPPRLSDAVVDARTQTTGTLAENAARRASTPDKLRRTLRGDLDTIVGKALKKRPAERYATVTGLTQDLRRYLDHQPISARPDTLGYRAAKLVRRHRVPVALAVVAALALAVGLIGTVTQARRATEQATLARQQRDFALRQLSRAEAVNELNAFLLSDAAPVGKSFTAGELLGRAEQILERQRGGTDENRAEILIALGRQYQSQDEDDKARKLLTEAYELTRRSEERAVRAKAACALADAVAVAGELDRAEGLLREGLAELPEEPQFVLHRVFCLLRGSGVAREADEGERAVERSQMAQRLLRESGQGSDLLELIVAMNLAESYRAAGRNREADTAFAQAWARLTAMGRGETERAGTLLNNWALVVRTLGRSLAAERLFRRAIEIGSAGGAEQGVSPMLLTNYARTLMDLGRLPEARAYADRALAQAQRDGNEVVITQTLFLQNLLYLGAGDLQRAASAMAEVEPRVRPLPPDHYYHVAVASQQGLMAQARGDADGARAAHDRAVALADEQDLPPMLLRRSAFALENGEVEAARSDAARALATARQQTEPGTLSSRIGRAQLALGRALLAQGAHGEAHAAFTAALEHLVPALGAEHPDTLEARRLALESL